jgi:hypothetical protein
MNWGINTAPRGYPIGQLNSMILQIGRMGSRPDSLPSKAWRPAAFNRGILYRTMPTLERLAHLGQGFVPGVGLGEERHIQSSEAMPYQHFGGMGGHEEDSLVRPLVQDRLGKLDAIALGHDHIDHHQIDSSASLTQDGERLGIILRFEDAIAFLTQNAVGDTAGDPFVIDNQNSGGRSWKRVGQLNLAWERTNILDSRLMYH